jgi:serine protease Do
MNNGCFKSRGKIRVWLAGLGLLAVLGAVALAAKSTLPVSTAANPKATPWYAIPAKGSPVEHSINPAGTEGAARAAEYAKTLSKIFREAAEKVQPAVVTITNTPQVAQVSGNSDDGGRSFDEPRGQSPFGEPPFGDMFRRMPELRRFFDEMPQLPEMPRRGLQGIGSGVIVDSSGVILTNNHVVEGGGNITVRLYDGREFDAVEVKQDPKTDLAIVRIEGAEGLYAAKLGNSDQTEVGDWVLALGQPFGLEGTVTAGIVSAKGRGIGITARENFIQTDAAINPGNSGGPLVNLDGEVVGINTAISSRNGAYQGVGFAIPVNLAKWVGGQLVEHGSVRRAYLGVMIQPVSQQLAEQFGVKVHEGVAVTEVIKDTPAAEAGLKPGDVIVQFDGKNVASPQELQGLVEQVDIGSQKPLVVVRDGKRVTLQVTLHEQPAEFGVAQRMGESAKPESSSFQNLGIEIETLTGEVAEQLGMKGQEGVVITDVRSGSPADQAGLESGMVITQANRKAVKSVEDLRNALERQALEKGVLLLVRTSEGSRFVVIRVDA